MVGVFIFKKLFNLDLLIGVHCSNGVDRAGYLICRYLIDRLGWSSHEAIERNYI